MIRKFYYDILDKVAADNDPPLALAPKERRAYVDALYWRKSDEAVAVAAAKRFVGRLVKERARAARDRRGVNG